MAMFSKAELEAAGIICPSCKTSMARDEQDNFYKCPQCKGQYWPNEPEMACPGCGRAMKFNKVFGYHKCSSCGSEFWPPSEEEETEEQNEDDPSSWRCSGRVYAGSYPGLKSNAVKPGGGGNSGGRKAKKKSKRFVDKYAVT